MNNLFQEIRRRQVFRIAGAYAVVGWLIIQLGIALEATLNLPGWFDTLLTVLVLIGFPIALLLAWAFEVTPEGVRRTESSDDTTTGKAGFGFVDIAILIALVGLVGASVFGVAQTTDTAVPVAVISSEVADVLAQTPAPAKSIAVLPFADMSPTGDQEYFSDGMAEEILNALVRVPELQVAGRTSSFAFKGRNEDIQTIGEALNVTHILEGSVRKQGDRVRITAQLIHVSDGFHMWSETYDGTLENIFDLQESVARAVTAELEIVLNVGEGMRLADVATNSTEAYDLLLRARAAFHNQYTVAALDDAERLIRQGLAIDPDMTEAWHLLARIYGIRSGVDGSTTPAKSFETITLAARRLNETAPNAPLTSNWLDAVDWFTGYAVGPFRNAKARVSQYPNSVDLAYTYGHILGQAGYSTQAVEVYERVVAIDPLFATGWFHLGIAAQAAGDYVAAERHLLRSLELGNAGSLGTLAWNDLVRHGPEAATKRWMQLFDLLGAQFDGGFGARTLWELAARATFDDSSADQMALRRLMTLQFAAPDFATGPISINYVAQLGMIEDFFKQFPDAYVARDLIGHMMWSDFDWARNIRQHPGFPTFVEELGYLAIWQEHGWPDKCAPLPGTDGTDGQFTCT